MELEIKPHTPYRGGIAVVKEFDKRHGECSAVIGGERIYPDGARRDGDPLGALIEPPENAFQRLKIGVRYWQFLVNEAVQVFQDTKHGFLQAAKGMNNQGHGAPDVNEAKAQLLRLQAVVEGRKKHLEEAQAELEETPEAERRRLNQIQTAANRQSCESFVDAIKAIQV